MGGKTVWRHPTLALCTYFICVFSAVCALSPNIEVLLTARIMQGLAGGLLVPAGQTILGLVVGRERLGRIIGTIGVAIVIAPLLGTSLGAVLLQVCGWRVLFLLMSPYLSVPGLRDGNYSSPDNKK
jgi:MFS family permease